MKRVLIALCALVLASSARADFVYSYVGNSYTSPNITDTTLVPGAYDTSMKITGSLTLMFELDANLNNSPTFLSGTGFSFSDGRQTIDQSNAFPFTGFSTMSFSTNSLGQITGWSLGLNAGVLAGLSTRSAFGDSAFLCTGSIFNQSCDTAQSLVPGTWYLNGNVISAPTEVAAVPGPIAGAGLPGLMAGLGAMLAWYRKRRAVAV
jgi:hypothetical protein